MFHRRHQVRDGEGFPLHEHDRASAGNRQFDSEIEPSASCADGEDVEGLGT